MSGSAHMCTGCVQTRLKKCVENQSRVAQRGLPPTDTAVWKGGKHVSVRFPTDDNLHTVRVLIVTHGAQTIGGGERD